MDVTDEVERLALLAEQGLISWEQFEVQRDALLGIDLEPSDDASTEESTASELLPDDPADAPTEVQRSARRVRRDLGAYRLEERVGKGGMGSVHRARHRVKPGLFAVKVLSPALADEPGFRKRFEREAKVGVTLNHPNVVDVLDFVIDGGRLALIMEYVEGENLAQRLRRVPGPIPWPEAALIFRQMLAAMAYAHGEGVVHRDIKPANVMVTPDGIVKIADFGVAHLEGASGTRTKMVLGTIEYMAPECFTLEHAPDQRADIYSLGMTLYKMVTDRLPWAPRSPDYVVMKLKEAGGIPSPRLFAPEVPESACRLIELATAKNPEDRAASCDQLIRLLDPALPMDQAETKVMAPRPREAPAAPAAVDPEARTAAWIPPDKSPPPAKEPAPRAPARESSGDPSNLALAAGLAVIAVIGLVLVITAGRLPENPEAAHGPRDLGLEQPVQEVPVAAAAEPSVAEPLVAAPEAAPVRTPAPRTTARQPRPPADDPRVGALVEDTGTLQVTSVLPARVLLGKQEVGRLGPEGGSLDLPVGQHRVRFVCADSPDCELLKQRSVIRTVEIEKDSTTVHSLDFSSLAD
ncbi:MAG: serine/threonine protein kinase [Proteobacteria bacterium]|nr:serine/threonine protein kinase [Pseudomonadota bacterium]